MELIKLIKLGLWTWPIKRPMNLAGSMRDRFQQIRIKSNDQDRFEIESIRRALTITSACAWWRTLEDCAAMIIRWGSDNYDDTGTLSIPPEPSSGNNAIASNFPIPSFSSTAFLDAVNFQYRHFPIPPFSSTTICLTAIFQCRHFPYCHFPILAFSILSFSGVYFKLYISD